MGHHTTEVVFLIRRGIGHFAVRDEGGAEHLLAVPDCLQSDAIAVEDLLWRAAFEAIGGAIDVGRVAARGNNSVVEDDPVDVDALHPAKADDVGDPAKLSELILCDGRAAVHLRLDVGGESEQGAVSFEPGEQIHNRVRLRDVLELGDESFGSSLEEVAGLDGFAVDVPGVARHDPADLVRTDAIAQQPEAGICSRLAGADDRIAVTRLAQLWEVVERRTAHSVGNVIRGRALRRDSYVHVGGVHERGRLDRAAPARRERHEIAGCRFVLGHREVRDAARREEITMHQVVVVGQHFGTGCEFVQASIPANGVFHIVAERARVHPVEGRRLMQPDERVGIIPVPTGPALPVDDCERCIRRFIQDGVGKRHAHRSGADDQVVRVHTSVSRSSAADGWLKISHGCRPAGVAPQSSTTRSGQRLYIVI